ncbi:MAG: PDZ domain-containing protein [Pirellulaceae bacterium]|nr:PDZ domain-containing protein [Pirellulaceae bacterium]
MAAAQADRSHNRVLAAFREVVSESTKSTVQITCDGQKAALGAIVDANGYIVTKASEIKGKIECKLQDGRKLPAQLIGRDPSLDLAMLKVEAKDLPVVAWRDEAPGVGSWLATPGLDKDPVAIGVVSVTARKIAAPWGFMGVMPDEDETVARIASISPRSAAEKAGLLAKDVITKINGKEVKGRKQLVDTIHSYQPGETVELNVIRGTEELNIRVTLMTAAQAHGNQGFPDRAEFQNNLGGPLSERRAGFILAIQHDTVLRPSECGGPIVDLDGKVIGINIARAGRVESYALPAATVRSMLPDLMSGKLAPMPVAEKIADKAAVPTAEPEKKVQ